MINNDIEKILITESQILEKSKFLGKKITRDYEGKDLVLLGLLKGCIPFISDLSKHIKLPVEVAYMVVSSYHGEVTSSLEVQIKYDLEIPVKNRHVLIVEDIVDTGNTINTVIEILKFRGAKSVNVVTLLDKPTGRSKPFTPKYIGFEIPHSFVVGYGLDYKQKYRNLPYVGVLKKNIYTKTNKESD